MLKQLPNGDWIDPSTIASVRVLPRQASLIEGHPDHPDRVVLTYAVTPMGAARDVLIECRDALDAQQVRDEIAGLRNSVLES